MAVSKVALSLPVCLLTRIDRLAKQSRLSRSAFVRRAVEQTLREPAEAEVIQKARRMYAEIGEEDRALVNAFLSLAAEPPPSQPRRTGQKALDMVTAKTAHDRVIRRYSGVGTADAFKED